MSTNGNSPDDEIMQQALDMRQQIQDSILHVLTVYPKISSTMLQVGIGTSISPSMWHPILERLIMDGIVEKKQYTVQTPKGRSQVVTIISLAPRTIEQRLQELAQPATPAAK